MEQMGKEEDEVKCRWSRDMGVHSTLMTNNDSMPKFLVAAKSNFH